MPFLVILPVPSTRNTPGVDGTLEELVELRELAMDELTELLVMLTLELELELKLELLDGGSDDDELERLDGALLPGTEDVPQFGAATTPNGDGCEAQVEREIQLLLFS